MKKSGISIKQLFYHEQRNKYQSNELNQVDIKNLKAEEIRKFLQKDQIYKSEIPIFCDMINKINKKNTNVNTNHQFFDRRINKLIADIKQQQFIDLQKCIQYFYNLRIFQLLKSVQTLNYEKPKGRLFHEILFLENLWKIFDTEVIRGSDFRIILKYLIDTNSINSGPLNKTKNQLQDGYKDLQKSWNMLKTGQIEQNEFKNNVTVTERYRGYSKQNEKPKILQTQRAKINNMIGSKMSISHKNSISNDDIQQLFTKISLNTLPSKGIFLENKQNQIVEQYTKQNIHYLQKDVVKRLYKNTYIKEREQIKKIREEQRQLQQLKNCTFKPAILKKQFRQIQQSKQTVNGYQKAIQRLRQGYYRFKQMKEIKEYIPRGENYQKIKKKEFNPPKFLYRKKSEPAEILFYIEIELGKKKVKVNIRENETAQKIATQIEKIYHLNKQMTIELIQIINIEYENYLSKANRNK